MPPATLMGAGGGGSWGVSEGEVPGDRLGGIEWEDDGEGYDEFGGGEEWEEGSEDGSAWTDEEGQDGEYADLGDDGGDDEGMGEEDEDSSDLATTDTDSTSGVEMRLPHLESEDVEQLPAFAQRRARLAAQGRDVGAHLVPFSLSYDRRRDPPREGECQHKLFFKIDGASSNCVRNAWRRAGFERTSKGGWNLWWGRPLKFQEHKKLNEYQKVCHFPGTYYLGRKDNLARNVSKFRRSKGPSSYPYLPVTYILPDDRARLLQDWRDRGEKGLYIVKPKASARGQGIRLVAKPDVEIKKGANVLVQRYIDDPLLIDGRKFDMRVYVLVTSFDPLRVYVFKEGLARFCSQEYHGENGKVGGYKSKLRHLTNYSLNKKSAAVEEEGDGEGIKWSLSHLKERLAAMGHDPAPVFERVDDLVVRTLLSVEDKINANMGMYVPHRGNCFELFGFDVMLDSALHPWLIEVNTSPSLATEWQLDKRIKNQLAVDMFNLLGVCGYSRQGMRAREEPPKKDAGFADKLRRQEIATGRRPPLASLTEGDADLLMECDEEQALAGSFVRVFPAPGSERYLPLFASQRYSNVLLNAWQQTPRSQRPPLPAPGAGKRGAKGRGAGDAGGAGAQRVPAGWAGAARSATAVPSSRISSWGGGSARGAGAGTVGLLAGLARGSRSARATSGVAGPSEGGGRAKVALKKAKGGAPAAGKPDKGGGGGVLAEAIRQIKASGLQPRGMGGGGPLAAGTGAERRAATTAGGMRERDVGGALGSRPLLGKGEGALLGPRTVRVPN